MKKSATTTYYYTRTTHWFDNENLVWKPHESTIKSDMDFQKKFRKHRTAIGIHALESGRWMTVNEIMHENKKYATQDWTSKDFTPDSYSQKSVEHDLKILIKMGHVKKLSGIELIRLYQ